MNRLDELRKFLDKKSLGIEIAPYFNPIVPKADGYNALVLDVFDTVTLRQHAQDDPNIGNEGIVKIEEVDIVSDASRLSDVVESKGLLGKVSYIVSSHNFEHLPDPISFLQGCSSALAPGGMLSMAIPDCRACFDHFRMPTRLSDWLGAFHRKQTQPSAETIFDFTANNAPYMRGDKASVGMNIASDSPDGFRPAGNLRAAYAKYVNEVQAPDGYTDAHCNVMFGASFELMVRDLSHLGLIDLEVVEILPTTGLEFFVHLRKPVDGQKIDESESAFYERRLELLREVNFLIGSQVLASSSKSLSPKTISRTILGEALFKKFGSINARRLAKRRDQVG